MPFTFLAHPAPAVAIANRWPGRLDGVALVMGSMAPDLVGVTEKTQLQVDAHAWTAFLLVPPLAWLMSVVFRRWLAEPLGQTWPRGEMGRLTRLRTRVGPIQSLFGGLVGGLTHVVWDAFTHEWQWGAPMAGLDTVLLGELTGARVLQYLGHTVGSAIGAWLLIKWLEEGRISRPAKAGFWILATGSLLGMSGGVWWATHKGLEFVSDVMRISVGFALGLTLAAIVWSRWSASDSPERVPSHLGDFSLGC